MRYKEDQQKLYGKDSVGEINNLCFLWVWKEEPSCLNLPGQLDQLDFPFSVWWPDSHEGFLKVFPSSLQVVSQLV